MASNSWVRTITSPFKKACTFFNHQPTSARDPNKKSHHHHHHQISLYVQFLFIWLHIYIYIYVYVEVGEHKDRTMGLQGEVMACGYEDVQVMWSILDKSNSAKPRTCNISS
ncbi:uncharacterized protein LOC127799217 [Diospyros lotus]|uniref:uncharacterized protein LOC127799217 n=1 Tax=Diospyros lotus TaxID=55363 RepID=UPI0022583D03|nr:uncharacterized protein LOC127799217 [Diospyros lotus]